MAIPKIQLQVTTFNLTNLISYDWSLGGMEFTKENPFNLVSSGHDSLISSGKKNMNRHREVNNT